MPEGLKRVEARRRGEGSGDARYANRYAFLAASSSM